MSSLYIFGVYASEKKKVPISCPKMAGFSFDTFCDFQGKICISRRDWDIVMTFYAHVYMNVV